MMYDTVYEAIGRNMILYRTAMRYKAARQISDTDANRYCADVKKGKKRKAPMYDAFKGS